MKRDTIIWGSFLKALKKEYKNGGEIAYRAIHFFDKYSEATQFNTYACIGSERREGVILYRALDSSFFYYGAWPWKGGIKVIRKFYLNEEFLGLMDQSLKEALKQVAVMKESRLFHFEQPKGG